MKETFIVRKVFILKNSALYLLTAYDLPFFHAKFQNSGSNSLATIPIWMKKLLGKFKQILIWKIFECLLKFFQLWKNFAKCKKLMYQQVFLTNLVISIHFAWIYNRFYIKNCLKMMFLRKILSNLEITWKPNCLSQCFEILHEWMVGYVL